MSTPHMTLMSHTSLRKKGQISNVNTSALGRPRLMIYGSKWPENQEESENVTWHHSIYTNLRKSGRKGGQITFIVSYDWDTVEKCATHQNDQNWILNKYRCNFTPHDDSLRCQITNFCNFWLRYVRNTCDPPKWSGSVTYSHNSNMTPPDDL